MASEKAKELAAKQKAAREAEKLRKKNSTDPRDWNQFRQIRELYRVTKEQDPQLPWILLACFVAPIVVFAVVGLLLNAFWSALAAGVMVGLAITAWILLRRSKVATYKRYAGQKGSAEIGLGMLDKKKWSYTPGLTANKQLDMVHRALGPGGIVLVGEGEPGRLKPLLASEIKRHEQVAYGVKVSSVIMGDKEGQVPLPQLSKHIGKLPKVLEPHQITEVKQRLRALDNMRPRAPIPRGPMPNARGAHRAMRGR